MEVSVEVLDGLSRKLTISVPPQEYNQAYQKKLASIQKTMKLDGFRAGKVPTKVIDKRFGESIAAEVAGDLIDAHFKEAIDGQKQKPASQPSLDEMPSRKEGEPFKFSVTYEVFPEFNLVELDGKNIEKEEVTIQPADIDTTIGRMRDQHATWIPVDRAAKNGDKITIDFEGSIDGEKFEGGKAEHFDLELGSGNMIPGFEDALLGAGAGDETTIDVTFPEDYHAKELAGKASQFAIKVHVVQEKQPLDDEALLKKLDIKGDMEELRVQTEKHMNRELNEVLKNRLYQKVFDTLLEANTFEVPEGLVKEEAKAMVKAQMQQYLGPDAVKKLDKLDIPLDPYLEDAKKRVRLGLLLEKVIEKHAIKADSAKVRTFVEKVAEAYDDPAAVISHYYSNPQALAGIKNAVVEEAAVEALLAKAAVDTVKKDYQAIIGPKA